MSKNIVVLCDGTGQIGGEGYNTNIYKLFNILEDRTKEQVVYYEPGLGTTWRKITGNIFGVGMSKNIIKCYRFIFDNYEAGDKIYLFGFSRGAAMVRSLTYFIHHFGILPQSRPELIDEAYNIYKSIEDKGHAEASTDALNQINLRAAEFVEKHHNMWTKIEFIGCFDTVAALGISQFSILDNIIDKFFKHKFQNFSLSDSVIRAYHALAIDDERKTFHPVLWGSAPEENQEGVKRRATQVWFCGMHTDVGGGYPEQTLSNIPLLWMIEKAAKYGVLFHIPDQDDLENLEKLKVKIAEDANGKMHNSREGTAKHFYLEKYYIKEPRYWNDGIGKPWVHQSVLDRANNPDNNYHPWILEKYKVQDQDYRVTPWVHHEEVLEKLSQRLKNPK